MSLYDFPVSTIRIRGKTRLMSNVVKSHDLETIVHRRDEKVLIS